MPTDNYYNYTTRSGDTYDLIALAVYSEETKASHIIKANPLHAGTIVFESGVRLLIPDISDSTRPETLPPWRR